MLSVYGIKATNWSWSGTVLPKIKYKVVFFVGKKIIKPKIANINFLFFHNMDFKLNAHFLAKTNIFNFPFSTYRVSKKKMYTHIFNNYKGSVCLFFKYISFSPVTYQLLKCVYIFGGHFVYTSLSFHCLLK